MPAKIITICNQKGGSGKTTVTMQLAGSLCRRGYNVLIVDADPQGRRRVGRLQRPMSVLFRLPSPV